MGPLGVVASCDYNGDNVADLALSLPDASGQVGETAPDAGQLRVLLGPAYGRRSDEPSLELAQANTALRVHGSAAGDRLGHSLACADLNADGNADVVVGAPSAERLRGRVYVFYGSPIARRVVDRHLGGDQHQAQRDGWQNHMTQVLP